MAETAFNEIQNLKKVGKLFPDFSKDLNGNLISMKGEIVVIKFIVLLALKNFEVNNLVRKYKDRKDIIFISLAEDTRTIKVVFS
jgi:hypothetical protein